MPKVLETWRGLVMRPETDSNEHMNVAYYTTKYDQATGQFFALLGYDFAKMKTKNQSIAYVESTVQYLREVLEDDAIHIETTLQECRNKVVVIKHEMKDSVTGALKSTCIMKWVVFNTQTRRAELVPEELREKILALA